MPLRLVPLALAAWLGTSPPVPESPSRPAIPGSYPSGPVSPSPDVPAELVARRNALSLGDVIDVALRNDPATRGAWHRAREAAADAASRAWVYFPVVGVAVDAVRARSAGFGGRFSNVGTTWGPALTVDWILLDFGERSGDVEAGRREAIARVWEHGDAVQRSILRATEAYYDYLDAKAQLEAARTGENEARTFLEAAERRRDAGVATIADVLLARTAYSQATLDRLSVEGRIGSLRGGLATAMGLPVSVSFDALPLPDEIPVETAVRDVEALLEEATSRRPDLAAARESWLAAQAEVRRARGEGLPRLSFSGSAGRDWYDPDTFGDSADVWSAALRLHIPVFTGYRNTYDVAKAKETVAVAAEDARALEQAVVLEVWTAFYELETAGQRVVTSRDLLASAEASEEVALGRYREGVGNLLDLLAAQGALARARAQEITARVDWLVARARLAAATGTLAPPASPGGSP
ncbi:MAG TPA: TolC family protein [Candidatus Polarisedimenticolaceae bacterium]